MVSEEAVILLTGGTGSFGHAFTRIALKKGVKALRIFSRGEYRQSEMARDFNDQRLRFLIGDVRDRERLAMAMYGCNYVVHAAAMKRIESCEYNPMEAVQTNVLGSANVVKSAIDAGVNAVIAISSDKSVEPINLYGATKMVMERLILGGNIYGAGIRFAVLRSGNFHSSTGSLMEIWQRQMDEGKPLTITDSNMTRFWVGTDEVAELAYDILPFIQGGEIFIPKMPEVAITEMVAPGIATEVIGRRPGEKLKEKLYLDGESPDDCGHYWAIRTSQPGGNL